MSEIHISIEYYAKGLPDISFHFCGLCPDLQLVVSVRADLWPGPRVMCWRGLQRKQRRRGGVILVRGPGRARPGPRVHGQACLAPNTGCTLSSNRGRRAHGGDRTHTHTFAPRHVQTYIYTVYTHTKICFVYKHPYTHI